MIRAICAGSALALDHDMVPDLAEVDARVREDRPQRALDQRQVGEDPDLEGDGLVLRIRDRQVGHADRPAADPELARADDGEVQDRRIADGDQRPGWPGDEILLEREDPCLVHQDIEGSVVALEALDERGRGARTSAPVGAPTTGPGASSPGSRSPRRIVGPPGARRATCRQRLERFGRGWNPRRWRCRRERHRLRRMAQHRRQSHESEETPR